MCVCVTDREKERSIAPSILLATIPSSNESQPLSSPVQFPLFPSILPLSLRLFFLLSPLLGIKTICQVFNLNKSLPKREISIVPVTFPSLPQKYKTRKTKEEVVVSFFSLRQSQNFDNENEKTYNVRRE